MKNKMEMGARSFRDYVKRATRNKTERQGKKLQQSRRKRNETESPRL